MVASGSQSPGVGITCNVGSCKLGLTGSEVVCDVDDDDCDVG